MVKTRLKLINQDVNWSAARLKLDKSIIKLFKSKIDAGKAYNKTD